MLKKCRCCKWGKLYKAIKGTCPADYLKDCFMYSKTKKTLGQLRKEMTKKYPVESP